MVWLVVICGGGQSSLHKLVFGVELGLNPNSTNWQVSFIRKIISSYDLHLILFTALSECQFFKPWSIYLHKVLWYTQEPRSPYIKGMFPSPTEHAKRLVIRPFICLYTYIIYLANGNFNVIWHYYRFYRWI